MTVSDFRGSDDISWLAKSAVTQNSLALASRRAYTVANTQTEINSTVMELAASDEEPEDGEDDGSRSLN